LVVTLVVTKINWTSKGSNLIGLNIQIAGYI